MQPVEAEAVDPQNQISAAEFCSESLWFAAGGFPGG
jgi:hypothetical protein